MVSKQLHGVCNNLMFVKMSNEDSFRPPTGNGIQSFGQDDPKLAARFLPEFDLLFGHEVIQLALAWCNIWSK